MGLGSAGSTIRSQSDSACRRAYRTLLPYVPRLTVDWADTAARAPTAGRRRLAALRRHLRLHQDVRAPRPPRQGRRRGGDRGDRDLLRARCSRSPTRAGGGLLKFGGDALLLLFTGTGHAERAAAPALGMQTRLADVGRIDTSAGRVVLRMSAGVHTGTFGCFLVGESHRELLLAGADGDARSPTWRAPRARARWS